MNGINAQNVKIFREGKEKFNKSYKLKSLSHQLYLNKAGKKKYKLTAEDKWVSEEWVWFHQAEWGGK